jgi:Na+/H+ antiporter NhaD/arsenite permease-like protein
MPLLVLLLLAGAFTAMAGESAAPPVVSGWLSLPFILLLLSIAVVPFISKTWWERNYAFVAGFLGAISVAYYLLILGSTERPLHTLYEYISFIALIGSLFVVSGGIHIRIRGKSTPAANVALLAIGAVVANIVGTTGASMILIRPYLRVNKYRVQPYHVVFFIFIVSNMGGALTPIGDPPLFLGYLKGVPFLWVLEQVWPAWLLAMGCILALFFIIDTLTFRRLPGQTKRAAGEHPEEGEVSGLHNILFLAVILAAVFITHPPFLREAIMLLAAAGSFTSTRHDIHRKNEFNFIPIKEVGILFLGIFAAMMPALDWLEQNATRIGIQTAGQFYWTTGFLSSFLDNAPTYLNFLSAEIGLLVSPEVVTQVQHLIAVHGTNLGGLPAGVPPDVAATFGTLLRYHQGLVQSGVVGDDIIRTAYLLGNHPLYVQAISLGAVFFGACTYIGNGPNFMVKSIANQYGVETPTFFGYIVKYTLPMLLPLFALVWFLFFR